MAYVHIFSQPQNSCFLVVSTFSSHSDTGSPRPCLALLYCMISFLLELHWWHFILSSQLKESSYLTQLIFGGPGCVFCLRPALAWLPYLSVHSGPISYAWDKSCDKAAYTCRVLGVVGKETSLGRWGMSGGHNAELIIMVRQVTVTGSSQSFKFPSFSQVKK